MAPLLEYGPLKKIADRVHKKWLGSLFARRHLACVLAGKRPIAGDGSLHPDGMWGDEGNFKFV